MGRFAVLLGILLCACTTNGRKDLLVFLQDGTTTRSEVKARIDQKPNEWVDGAIWTFRIGEDSGGLFPSKSVVKLSGAYLTGAEDIDEGWADARYSLVLEFDASDRLRRHALVDVKGP